MGEFLIIGGIGVVLLLVLLVVGDVLEGINHFEAFGGELFSSAGLAGFIGALGFGGAIALSLTHSYPVAVGAGVVLGLLVGWLVGWLTRKIKDDESQPALRTASLVGLGGTVISDIPVAGYGEVRLFAGGQPMKINARADHPLAAGTRVWVSDVLSATAVQVQAIDALEAGPEELQ